MESIRIDTERLILFTANEENCELILSYQASNRKFFTPWIPAMPDKYYTYDYQMLLIREDKTLLRYEHKIKFYIIHKNQPYHIIGDFSYSNIIKGVFKSCFLGYKQDEKSCGNGYMHEALSKANQFIFEDLKLNRIEANIIPRNEASIDLIQKLGFEQEGYSKKYLKINHVWEDHLRFAKLNTLDV